MLAPNKLLQNRYRILRPIGQGGMGAVYLATDERLGNEVALKETLFNDEWLRKAFEREARLLANLHHASLPKVIDHFSEGHGQFLVMGFIPGDDLAEMLKRQGHAFPVEKVIGWAYQLLDALDYLHTQEPPIIHRDIKPQNLKLTKRGQIILLDFGLAKGLGGSLSVGGAGRSVLGYTPNFAPLEQIQGTGTSSLSDLYSLAGTLYNLLTGIPPPDALTRATSVLSGQTDPLKLASEVYPKVPLEIASILQKAMALNPSARPRTAEEMRRLLGEADEHLASRQESNGTKFGNRGRKYTQPGQHFSDLPLTVLPPQSSSDAERTMIAQPFIHLDQSHSVGPADTEVMRSSNRRLPLIFGSIFLVLVIAGLIWWRSFSSPSAQNSTQRSVSGVGEPISIRSSLSGELKTESSLYEVAISGDGQLLATTGDENRVRLWRTSDRSHLKDLTSSDYLNPGRCVAISSDGKMVVAGSDDGKIRLWQVSDGRLLKSWQGHTDYVFMMGFSPDNQTIFSASADKTIRTWRVNGMEMLSVLKVPGPDELIITISQDQKLVALYSPNQEVRLWSLSENRLVRTLAGHRYPVSSGAFSPDGQTLALGSKDGTLRLWRVSDGNLLLTLKGTSGTVGSAAFSPDNLVIAAGGGDGIIRLWRMSDGNLLGTLTGQKKIIQSLMFSMDGRFLVSGSDDKTVRLWQIAGVK